MATTVTKTVKPSGGDYTSLSAWEAGQQGDLVALDQIQVAECYAMADTTAVAIASWTTDATRYWKVYAPTSERHDGEYNTSKYRIEAGSGALYGIDIQDAGAYGVIDSIQIKNVHTAANTPRAILARHSSGTITISHNVLWMNNGGGSVTVAQHIGWDFGGNYKIYDNLLIDSNALSSGIDIAGTNYIYNNTYIGCAIGMKVTGTAVAKNNLMSGCTTAASGTFAAGTDYNATNNASMGYTVTGGGNTHDRLSQTFSFVGGSDYHLLSSDAGAKDSGLDLSADANLPFSDDIDGQTRTGSWDIGADEYAAVVATDPGAVFLPRFGWAPNRNPFKRRRLRASPSIIGPNDANTIPFTSSLMLLGVGR